MKEFLGKVLVFSIAALAAVFMLLIVVPPTVQLFHWTMGLFKSDKKVTHLEQPPVYFIPARIATLQGVIDPITYFQSPELRKNCIDSKEDHSWFKSSCDNIDSVLIKNTTGKSIVVPANEFIDAQFRFYEGLLNKGGKHDNAKTRK